MKNLSELQIMMDLAEITEIHGEKAIFTIIEYIRDIAAERNQEVLNVQTEFAKYRFRKDKEIEALKSDVDSLNKDLETAQAQLEIQSLVMAVQTELLEAIVEEFEDLDEDDL